MIDIQKIWPAWQIEELIGQGAYGKVYRIRREELGVKYYAALKVIEIPADESEVRSLMGMGMDGLSIRDYFEGTAKSIANEIQIMESLKSAANIVHVEEHYLEEHKDSIGWTILIRMELLESMRKYQQREGAPDLKETLKIGKDICRALTYCEEKHVIHRDIKPDNIFRTEFGDYKLGDFGIARQMENTKSVYSQKGTSGYMAPEVNRGEKYDKTVDIYSLGVMLYQMMNRLRLPFVPTDTNKLTPQILEEAQWKRFSGEIPPAPVDAPPALANIILKAMHPDPARRYRNAQQFLNALEAYENGKTPVAPPEPENKEPAAPVHWNTPNAAAKPAAPASKPAAPANKPAAASKAKPAASAAPQSSSQPFQSKFLSEDPKPKASKPAASASKPAAAKPAASASKPAASATATTTAPEKKSSAGRVIFSIVLVLVVYFAARGLGKKAGQSMSSSGTSSGSTASSVTASSSDEDTMPDAETLDTWNVFALDELSYADTYLNGEGSYLRTETLESIGNRMAELGYQFVDENQQFHDEVYIEQQEKCRWLRISIENCPMEIAIQDWHPGKNRYIYYSGRAGLTVGDPVPEPSHMTDFAWNLWHFYSNAESIKELLDSYSLNAMADQSFHVNWNDNSGIYLDYTAPEGDSPATLVMDDKTYFVELRWSYVTNYISAEVELNDMDFDALQTVY